MTKSVLRELLGGMSDPCSAASAELPWPLRVLRVAEKTVRFSAYLTYATYAESLVAAGGEDDSVLRYHPLKSYGTNIFTRGHTHTLLCIDSIRCMLLLLLDCTICTDGAFFCGTNPLAGSRWHRRSFNCNV